MNFIKEIVNPSIKAIINKAIEKNMPIIKLDKGDFYQIGYGKKGNIFSSALGDKINGISLKLVNDNLLISEFLKSQYIPIVDRKKVHNINELLEVSNNIGFPILLKTKYKNNNNNTIFNINDDETLVKSYEKISEKYKDIILEKHIEGKNFKVCVIDYKVVAVVLISNFTSSKEDKAYLNKNETFKDKVIMEDFTENICEENKKICEKIAKILGLDICEVDICSKNLAISLNKSGAIIDVNANLDITIYENFHKSQKRDIADAILNMIYENHIENIPVVSILGNDKRDIIAKGINYILSKMGYVVGVKTKDKIIINNQHINKGKNKQNVDAKSIFLNKEVDIGIVSQTKEDVIHKGLNYDFCDVAIIKECNILEKLDGLDLEKLVLNSIKDKGYLVISLECYNNINTISEIKTKKIFFSIGDKNELLKQSIELENIVVYVDNEIIYAKNNKKTYMICNIKDISMLSKPISKKEIESILAICAALIGLKVDYCMIAKGLKMFKINDIV